MSEIRPLVTVRRPPLGARQRRLAKAHTIEDLRDIARRRVPRSVFDYVDGAAEQEISIRRARAAFEAVEGHPRVLRDVSTIDTRAEVLGATASLPLVLAPTGFTRMMHHEGETAVARAAARANSLRAVHDGDHRSGDPSRLRAVGPTVVPALPVEGP